MEPFGKEPPLFVPPTPVYGVEQPDGTLTQPTTVAEGAAVLRARLAAEAPMVTASNERRAVATLIDLGIGIGAAAGWAATTPTSTVAQIAIALGVTFALRLAFGVAADGRSPGRLLLGLRAIGRNGSRLGLWAFVLRDIAVLAYGLIFPLLLFVRLVWLWYVPYRHTVQIVQETDTRAIHTVPAPQDISSATTVATDAEVRRFREHAARMKAARAGRPMPTVPASPAAAAQAEAIAVRPFG